MWFPNKILIYLYSLYDCNIDCYNKYTSSHQIVWHIPYHWMQCLTNCIIFCTEYSVNVLILSNCFPHQNWLIVSNVINKNAIIFKICLKLIMKLNTFYIKKIHLHRAKYTSSGVQNFIECSRLARKLTVNISDFSYASTRSNNLSKLKSYIARLKSTKTSRGFLSLKILL